MIGRMWKLLPLHKMAVNFGLVEQSLNPKLGRKSYFTHEGKVALMFLKMYTQLSAPKLLEQLNGNLQYQIFCVIYINPEHP
ncbi:MAG: DDE transposase, partial [Bacteroidales bacterium]|nr:DDE transposase [Bacteroidales bacterium]